MRVSRFSRDVDRFAVVVRHVAAVYHADLPAEITVRVALIIDEIGRVAVGSPLEKSRLAFFAVQLQRPLVSAKRRERVGRVVRILYPFA